MSIILKNRQDDKNLSPDELKERVIEFDDVMANRFNHVWNVLSVEHKKALKSKITEVTRLLFAKDEIRESLGIIQEKTGYKITKKLEQFQRQAIRFIEEIESQKGQKSMPDYLQTS